MIETGHSPACVCGSCSSLRRECAWPQPRDPDTGQFAEKIERWGHNWLPVRANLLHCDHCGQDAYFKIEDIDGEFATVTLADV